MAKWGETAYPINKHIEPLEANSMVEKWLNEMRLSTQSTNRLNLLKRMAWSKMAEWGETEYPINNQIEPRKANGMV